MINRNPLRFMRLLSCWAVAMGALGLPVKASEIEQLAYDVRFAGLTVGQALFTIEESDVSYRTKVDMVSSGIIAVFADFRAIAEGRGAFKMNGFGQPVPVSFQREWSISDIASTMTITHDADSGVAKKTDSYVNPNTGEIIDPAEEFEWAQGRVEVPAGLRVDVFDPISAFVYARHRVTELNETQFSVPLYDGRRRYDMKVAVGESTPIQFAGDTVGSQVITLSFAPVFGFDAERAERLMETAATFYFSEDTRFLPYRVEVSTGRGSAIMELSGDCTRDAVSCEDLLAKLTEVAS